MPTREELKQLIQDYNDRLNWTKEEIKLRQSKRPPISVKPFNEGIGELKSWRKYLKKMRNKVRRGLKFIS